MRHGFSKEQIDLMSEEDALEYLTIIDSINEIEAENLLQR